ncbi:rhodanese-like domain-containing protein [Corynebacterium auris]|uniref:rhodanese-like domain-containing protein n=1 Tax=Corynebacterium auris TaxID=44750 RepID=UPI0025B59748|nr:rhodanese-like domain-containing protein [Corynebacterium auris]WJY68819.1 putative adenylyltransferase/sulfurtransferase MoeZ [Corynebacterium auris]
MRTVTVKEVPANAQLIDVREPEEYTEVHAANAVNIPLSELTARYGEIDPDREIYVICRSGGRSAQACEYFERALGWDSAINVEGGTIAWEEAGLPTR